MLSVKDVVVRFGGVVALDGPTFEVAAGEICGLIGPNGAGKTTLFNCISRLARPDEGTITFEGDDLLDAAHLLNASRGEPPAKRAERQDRTPFAGRLPQ